MIDVSNIETEDELRERVVEAGIPWWPFTRSSEYEAWRADHPNDSYSEGVTMVDDTLQAAAPGVPVSATVQGFRPNFDPAKHPHRPKGSPLGGQWAPKGVSAEIVAEMDELTQYKREGVVGISYVKLNDDGSYSVMERSHITPSQKYETFSGSREEVARHTQDLYDGTKKVAEDMARRDADQALTFSNRGRVTLNTKEIPNQWAVDHGYADWVDVPQRSSSGYGYSRPQVKGVRSIRWHPDVNGERVLVHYIGGTVPPDDFAPGTPGFEQFSYLTKEGTKGLTNKAKRQAEVQRIMQLNAALVAAGFVFDELTAAAVDFTDGSMVALYPRPEEAEAIAVEGGQPAETLHVTLAFLPEGVESPEWLAEQLGALATWFARLDGHVGGLGMFEEGPDGVPVIALPDVVGLADLRVAVCELLGEAEVVVSDTHGFQPHLTLTYGDAMMDPPIGAPLTFDALSLVVGAERWDFPFGAALVAAFDESKHARVKPGTANRKRDPREGGQFAPKEGGSSSSDYGLGYDEEDKDLEFKKDQMPGTGQLIPQAAAPDLAAREILKGTKDTQQMYAGSGPFGYTTARVADFQNPWIGERFAGHSPSEDPTTLFMAGGPGSGKSSVLGAKPELAPPDAVYINPDDAKLANPEYKAMHAAGSTYAAAGTHEESSSMGKRALGQANRDRFNAVLDGTGDSGTDSFMGKINAAKDAGRKVKVVMVDIPTDEAVSRAQIRANDPKSDSFGRVVAEGEIRRQHKNVSRNHLVWRDEVDDWEVWSNDKGPKLIARRVGGGEIEVLDEARYKQAIDKADESTTPTPKRRFRRGKG